MATERNSSIHCNPAMRRLRHMTSDESPLIPAIARVLPHSTCTCMFEFSEFLRRVRAPPHLAPPGGSMLHRKVVRWMPLVIAAFFVGRATHAQTGRITGQVTDTAGGRPMAGVEIQVVVEGERAQFGVRTDAAEPRPPTDWSRSSPSATRNSAPHCRTSLRVRERTGWQILRAAPRCSGRKTRADSSSR